MTLSPKTLCCTATVLALLMQASFSVARADPPSAPPTAPPPPSSAAPAAAAPNNVDETSATYVSGYSDGCASANPRYAQQEHIHPNRDAKLYESDNDYHEGWDHGYRKCEDKISPGGMAIPGNSVVL